MTRRKPSRRGERTGGGVGHPASLANLRRSRTAGVEPRLSHGGYAAVAVEQLAEAERRVFAAVAADAPLRGPDGGLPAADAVPVRLLADVLVRLDRIGSYLRDRGWLDEAGNPRPVLDHERALRAQALDLARELGLTPRSRAQLGLDVQRGFDLAAHWAEQEGAGGA